MTKNKDPIVKFILNKGELGNIHTALKTIITEELTAGPKEDAILMNIMGELAPIYDGLAHGEVTALELDPESAHTCWKALSYIGENGLLPKSQNAKVITLIQHMGYALECLNNIQIDPKEVVGLSLVKGE